MVESHETGVAWVDFQACRRGYPCAGGTVDEGEERGTLGNSWMTGISTSSNPLKRWPDLNEVLDATSYGQQLKVIADQEIGVAHADLFRVSKVFGAIMFYNS